MPEQGVVVGVDLRIEREQRSIGRRHEGVQLQKGEVLLYEEPVQAGENHAQLLAPISVKPQREPDPPRLERLQPGRGIDEFGDDPVGLGRRQPPRCPCRPPRRP